MGPMGEDPGSVSSFAKRQSWDLALSCLLQQGPLSDGRVYVQVVKACAQRVQWQHALLVTELPAPPSSREFIATAAVNAMGKATRWTWALEILQRLQSSLQVGLVTYNATLSALAQGQFLEDIGGCLQIWPWGVGTTARSW